MAVDRFSNAAGPQTGLIQVVPTSLTLGSGSATTSASGTITTTSVTSISFNNVFSDSFDSYQVRISGLYNSSATGVYYRLRNNTTDETGSTYGWNRIYATDSGALTKDASWYNTYWLAGSVGELVSHGIVDILGPFKSSKTTMTSNYLYQRTANAETGWVTGSHTLATSYNGFSFVLPSGTFSGTFRIYGYNN